MDTNNMPETLLEAIRHFSDPAVCYAFMVSIRWPDGKITCPVCGGENIGVIASRRMFQCKAKACRKQFSVKVGTIMEDSPIGLDKWLAAIWLIANAKNGVSSWEIHRSLGITQKSAWFLLHRIRLAMQQGSFRKLSGEVEVDETFIGGKARNMHKAKRERVIKGRGASGKSIVIGVLERGGAEYASQIRTKVIPNTQAPTVQAEVRENVEPGSVVNTDALASYVGLVPDYVHEAVDHAVEFVRGNVHTNGLENYWSLLKRCIKGTYVSVGPYHLFRYLDEENFRFNEREGRDGTRFTKVASAIGGKRVTYAKLTGK